MRGPQGAEEPRWELREDEKGLALVSDGMVLRGSFERMLPRVRPDRLSRELLVRAARVKGVAHPQVVDATAGLGEDSFLLAAAGFELLLFERDPQIAALLADALRRAALDERLAPIAARMTLRAEDSIAALATGELPADVVLLDPMFPSRNKSAAVKKKLQLIQLLEKPCDDERALMDAALAARPRKIVVKRPAKGPLLAGVKPSHSLSGKAIRYDVIVPPPTRRP
jgi:16S rRNA (guanine1516-N2)-methyltransferase